MGLSSTHLCAIRCCWTSALMGLNITILQNYSNKNRHNLVIQAKKKITLLSFNSGCSDCTDSRGQECLNSRQLRTPPSMPGISAPLPVWDMKHTGNSGNLGMLSVSPQMGAVCYHKHGCLLVRCISHKTLWEVCPYGTWQGNERAVFGDCSRETLPIQCRLVLIIRAGKAQAAEHQWHWENHTFNFPAQLTLVCKVPAYINDDSLMTWTHKQLPWWT